MGADYPDWGGQYNDTAFYPLFDLGELAVRLGSPVTYDRRGNIVWYDNFEYGLVGVDQTVSGTGSAISLNATTFENPPFSAKLVAGTTNPSTVGLIKTIPPPQSKNVGFSAMVRPGTNLDSITLEINHILGGTQFVMTLVFNLAAQTITLLDTLSNPFTLATGFSTTGVDLFFTFLKLVVDTENRKGVRAIVNGFEFDLSGYTITTASTGTSSRMSGNVYLVETGGVAVTSYIDNMFITASEPDNS